jgi:hypothetical protein
MPGEDERALKTVQRRVVAQILLDREIEVEDRLRPDLSSPAPTGATASPALCLPS